MGSRNKAIKLHNVSEGTPISKKSENLLRQFEVLGHDEKDATKLDGRIDVGVRQSRGI